MSSSGLTRSLAALALLGLLVIPARAQGDPHQHHHHPPQPTQPIQPIQPAQPTPPAGPDTSGLDHSHGAHGPSLGPAGATYDLRWLDAMVQHHTGALRMSEFMFDIGQPGVGALARAVWRDQAQEIKAMGQWRKAWYPEAPVYPVALRPGGDPDSLAGLQRMQPAQIQALRMEGAAPSRSDRVTWFLEGMIAHHGGALQMAHDALDKSRNPTVRRLARQIIVAQRREILALRHMLGRDGLDKPAYRQFDALFTF